MNNNFIDLILLTLFKINVIQNKYCSKILFPHTLVLVCNEDATAIQRKRRKEKSPLQNNILKPLYFHNTNNFMNFTNFINFINSMYYT